MRIGSKKKKPSVSPTQRTLKLLKGAGYKCGIVERYINAPHLPGGGKRIDLFNIIDLIAIKPGIIIGCQSCGVGFSDHHSKLTEEKRQESLDWLESGCRLSLVGWRKIKNKLKAGGYGTGYHYAPRIRHYYLHEGGLAWKDKKNT